VLSSPTESDPFAVRLSESAIDAGGVLETPGHDMVATADVGPDGNLYAAAFPFDRQTFQPLPGSYLFGVNPDGGLVPGCDEPVPIGDAMTKPLAVHGVASDVVVVVGATSDGRIAIRAFAPDCAPLGDLDFIQFRDTAAGAGLDSAPNGAFADAGALTVFGGARVPLSGGGTQLRPAMIRLQPDWADPETQWAMVYDTDLQLLTAAAPVKAGGNPGRIAAAGPNSGGAPRFGFFDAATGTQVGSTAAAPFTQFALQQQSGRGILGGTQLMLGSQGPQDALGAAGFAATPPPTLDSGFGWSFDPFAGSFLTMNGLGSSQQWLWAAWTGFEGSTETAGVTRAPAAGGSVGTITIPLDGAQFPLLDLGPPPDPNDPPITVTPRPGVPTPAPNAAPEADLAAFLAVDREYEFELRTAGTETALPLRVTVENRGPAPAADVRVRNAATLTRTGGGSESPDAPFGGGVCSLAVRDLECGVVAPSTRIRETVGYLFEGPGTVVVNATASSTTQDPEPANNVASLEVEVEWLPDSDGLRFRSRGTAVIARAAGPSITGKARRAHAVYVALARRRQGAKVRASAASCAWLRNARGAVRRERARSCDEPVWLKARGRRNFRLNLGRALPPGRYTALSRAVAGSGVTESSFRAKDGNRQDFRIAARRRSR
jgi:hypothetical protein